MGFNYENGELSCQGVALSELAGRYGTPLYVYDFNAVRSQVEALRSAFGDFQPHIAYAVKANGSLSLLKLLSDLDCGFDIVSGGELLRVQRVGGDTSKVVFSGVGKSPAEIDAAIEANILMLSVESEEELRAIEVAGKHRGKRVPISLRINPEIDGKTHPYLTTGLKQTKFGIPAERGFELYRKFSTSQHVMLRGLNIHIGTQVVDREPFTELCHFVRDYCQRLKKEGIELTHIDIGGGLGINYGMEEPLSVEDYAKVVKSELSDLDIKLVIEPGRFIIGSAGVLLSQVLYHKQNSDHRFVIVDASMAELIRPSLYGAYHEIKPLKPVDAPKEKLHWVGPVCESADFMAKDRLSHPVAVGDYIAVMSAGAYGFTMASNYCARLRPAEVAIFDGQAHLIHQRESYEALLDREEIKELVCR